MRLKPISARFVPAPAENEADPIAGNASGVGRCQNPRAPITVVEK